MVASVLCGLYIDYSLMLVPCRIIVDLYMLCGLYHYRNLSHNNITTLDSGALSGLGYLLML